MLVLIRIVVRQRIVEIPQPKPRTFEEALAQLIRRLRQEAKYGRSCSTETAVRVTVTVQTLVVCFDDRHPAKDANA